MAFMSFLVTTSVKFLLFFEHSDTISFESLLACTILYINDKQIRCSVFNFVQYILVQLYGIFIFCTFSLVLNMIFTSRNICVDFFLKNQLTVICTTQVECLLMRINSRYWNWKQCSDSRTECFYISVKLNGKPRHKNSVLKETRR